MEPLGRSSHSGKEFVRSAHGLWKVRSKNTEMENDHIEIDSSKSGDSDLDVSFMGSSVSSRSVRRNFALLMQAPFFVNLNDSGRPDCDNLVCGRCCSCNDTLVATDCQPENLIRHLKIAHPELYAKFEAEQQSQQQSSHIRAARCNSSDSSTNHSIHDDAEEIIDLELASDVGGKPNADDENVVGEPYADDVNVVGKSNTDEVIVLSDGSDDEYDENIEVKPEISDNDSMMDELSYTASVQDSLISSAAMTQINELLNEKLSGFVTKIDFQSMAENLAVSVKAATSGNKRKHSVDDSNVAAELNFLKKKYKTLHSAIDVATQGKLKLQREIEDMDRRLHMRDVIFYNVPVEPNKQPRNAIADLLMNRFQLNDSVVDAVTIVKEQGYSNKFTLLVKFGTDQVAQHVLRNSFLLKNTGVFVETRMSIHVRKRKQKLMSIRQELLRRDPDLRVTVRGNLMIVCETQFRWDDTEGLCLCDPSVVDDPLMSAADYLKSITELNISDFLTVLKEYTIGRD